MRVLHLVSEKVWRGGEQFVAYLIEELQNLGVQNYVACKKDSPFAKFCVSQSISSYSFSFSNHFDLSTSYKIYRAAKSCQADIIHIHSSRAQNLAMFSCLFGKMPPFVLSRRVVYPVKNNIFSKFKYNFTNIKYVFCVSEKVKNEMLKVVNSPEKCVVIHDGIDASRFFFKKKSSFLRYKYHLQSNDLIIGQIAALSPEKDYFTFIDCAKIISENLINTKFFVIGDGSQFENIKAYIDNKQMNNRIIMTGFFNNITEILQELDVLMLTSLQEGLPAIIMEAFASKVPVVATDAGGVGELIQNDQTGLLCEVKNSSCLADNTIKILKDDMLKKRLTDNAYEHCLKNFTKEKMAEKSLKVYQEIINQHAIS